MISQSPCSPAGPRGCMHSPRQKKQRWHGRLPAGSRDRPPLAATCHPQTRLLGGDWQLPHPSPEPRVRPSGPSFRAPEWRTCGWTRPQEGWPSGKGHETCPADRQPGCGPGSPADLPWVWGQVTLVLSPERWGCRRWGTEVASRGGVGCCRGADAALSHPVRSVADINECRRYPGRLCGHKCENTPGSYFCSCTVGFRLSADGRSCEGEAVRAGRGAPGTPAPGESHHSPCRPAGTDSSLFPKHVLGDMGPLVRDDSSPGSSRALGCLGASAQGPACGD